MKEIIIKQGNKTTFKLVPDNYQPTDDVAEGDLTTSGKNSISVSMPIEKWHKIFDKNN